MTIDRVFAWLWASSLIAVSSLACADAGGGDEVSEGDQVCVPGAVIDCACSDGSMATQTCNTEGSAYDACTCEGGESEGTSAADTSTSGTETSTTATTDTTDTSGTETSTEGPVGAPPLPEIYHPGDGEVRKINTPIPWIGVATDAEDGDLTGMALVWSSDLDGEFGTGTMFDAPLTSVGVHVISLTATDSDAQQGVATIELTLEP